MLAVERGNEPVVEHQVDDGAVAEPVAEARLLEDVGRVRHRLHAPGDDHVVVARADHLVGDLDRAHARGAHLVDGVARDLLRKAGADGRLPRRGLAGAALEHLPHDHVLDLVVADVDAVERAADRAAPSAGAS